MNNTFRCFFFLFLLITALPIHALAEKEPQLLRDITFDGPSGIEERITFQLNGTLLPKVFAIKGENPRLVFDFPNTKAAAVLNNIIDTNGNLIKKIRIGIHGDDKLKTRVVLDLSSDSELNFSKNFDEKTNSLVVSVQPIRANGAQQKNVSQSSMDAQKQVPKTASPAPNTQPNSTPASEAQKQIPPQNNTLDKTLNTDSQTPPPPVQNTAQPKTEQTAKDQPPVLESIKFDAGSNKGEMILFKLNDFYPPIVFGLEESLPRVVCDFINTTAAQEVANIIECDGKFIKTIRVGKHSNPNKVRVVLDLVPNKNYDLQQVFFKEDNLFVIIVNTLTESGEKPES
ncbi:MAG: AMIN domain-containing protein [Desulfobulbaceae bacterium]|nr:AMIN domain-containing protein [Desulfobulbaceae bacterium]